MSEYAPEIRIGDRQRRDADARLQAALADGVLTLTEYDERAGQCWGARTQSDLDVLLRDLPQQRAAARSTPVEVQRTSDHPPRRVVAVMSQGDLASSVAPGQELHATAVMGAADVDLRLEDLPDEVHVRATAVMGEVKVHVPPGSTVHLSGMAVMGERKNRVAAATPGGPVVHVHATAVMGTVSVDDATRDGGLLPSVAAPQQPDVRRHRSPRRRVVRSLIAVALVGGGAYGVEQVATADDGSALFGNTVVHVRPDQRDVSVATAFGNVDVVVPEGTQVVERGRVVFGNIECNSVCSTGGDGRTVVVHGGGAFGNVTIETQSQYDSDH